MAETTTTQKDPAEYQKVSNEHGAATRQRDACEQRIKDLEYNKERLQKKYDWVSDLKEAFKPEQKQTKKVPDEDHKWKGSTYTDFVDKVDWVISENDIYYKDSLDYAHDQINNKLTEIENKLLEERGLFGRLCAKVNTLWNKLQNWGN